MLISVIKQIQCKETNTMIQGSNLTALQELPNTLLQPIPSNHTSKFGELVIQNGIVLKGERAVIPLALPQISRSKFNHHMSASKVVSEELLKLCIGQV